MNNSIIYFSYFLYRYNNEISVTFNPCKNLNDEFENVSVSEIDTDHLRVYLRMRPSLQDENEEEVSMIFSLNICYDNT